MKKLVALLVAVMFTLGLASAVFAADMTAKGKIVAVDAKASTITIEDGGNKVVVKIGAEDLAKAKEGMKAKVTYADDKGTNVASKVKISAAKAAQGC